MRSSRARANANAEDDDDDDDDDDGDSFDDVFPALKRASARAIPREDARVRTTNATIRRGWIRI